MNSARNIGAFPNIQDRSCYFSVWAPHAHSVDVVLPVLNITARLAKDTKGYHSSTIPNVIAGSEYFFSLDGKHPLPDPASRFQPNGVHQASQVTSQEFSWTDENWRGKKLENFIVYEIHTGTFTKEGTFDAAIFELNRLVDLGVTALEIMPVSQFPGERNWGYDGVFPFAPQASYGGPNGLKRLINACHTKGLAVILDVVYNHLGPEGNYLAEFGPYFTDKYHTPWGKAINFDDWGSDEVREYFINNALYWYKDFHVDALRLDAVHAIYDASATHFLEELASRRKKLEAILGRTLLIIAESDLNDPRLITSQEKGGYGLDAQWSDDFHHAVHTLLTGEKYGYYEDFGNIIHLETSLAKGQFYSGNYSSFRNRRHGRNTAGISLSKFVVCIQNHDQIGNRMLGERLATLVNFEQVKLAAGCLLLGPATPLLFMGEEYAEEHPFLYFVSHTDEKLIEAVRNGRKNDFAAFRWVGDPPDPQSQETFEKTKLTMQSRLSSTQRICNELYRTLLHLRKSLPACVSGDQETLRIFTWKKSLAVLRTHASEPLLICFNFSPVESAIPLPTCFKDLLLGGKANVQKRLDSAAPVWNGPGSKTEMTISFDTDFLSLAPSSFALFY